MSSGTPVRVRTVLLNQKSGSPEDTDLERISLRGPRIKDLGQVVRDHEWCPVAITNSLCVKRVRASRLLNTAESVGSLTTGVLAGPLCYTASMRVSGGAGDVAVVGVNVPGHLDDRTLRALRHNVEVVSLSAEAYGRLFPGVVRAG